MFIDETGAKTNMTRQRGRAMEGNRLFAKAPHGHWGTTTLISSVRLNGATAAMEIAGATDSEVFREYVRRILAPTLSPGDLVVMDNLRTHYDAAAIAMIECSPAVLRPGSRQKSFVYRQTRPCRWRGWSGACAQWETGQCR